MNGPEHYRAAEKLLSQASFWRHGVPSHPDGTPMTEAIRADMIARAQVHATLALAAASALTTVREFFELDHEAEAWREAAARRPAGSLEGPESFCLKKHEFGECTRAKDHEGECNSERMPF